MESSRCIRQMATRWLGAVPSNSDVDSRVRYKADKACALYAASMKSTGDVRVSQRGQMSLPAAARHRWGLDGGGEVGYLDVGEAIILIPGGVDNLRHRLFEALPEEDWAHTRDGHGDPDLANQ